MRERERGGGGGAKQSVFYCVHEQEASIINLDNDSLLPTLLPLSFSCSLLSDSSEKTHSPSFKLLRKTIAYIERNVRFKRRKQLLTETKVHPSVFVNNFPTVRISDPENEKIGKAIGNYRVKTGSRLRAIEILSRIIPVTERDTSSYPYNPR